LELSFLNGTFSNKHFFSGGTLDNEILAIIELYGFCGNKGIEFVEEKIITAVGKAKLSGRVLSSVVGGISCLCNGGFCQSPGNRMRYVKISCHNALVAKKIGAALRDSGVDIPIFFIQAFPLEFIPGI
jgi:hypothetical protein